MTVGDLGVGTILRICVAQVGAVGIPTVGIILAHPWLLQFGMIGPAAMIGGNGMIGQAAMVRRGNGMIGPAPMVRCLAMVRANGMI